MVKGRVAELSLICGVVSRVQGPLQIVFPEAKFTTPPALFITQAFDRVTTPAALFSMDCGPGIGYRPVPNEALLS